MEFVWPGGLWNLNVRAPKLSRYLWTLSCWRASNSSFSRWLHERRCGTVRAWDPVEQCVYCGTHFSPFRLAVPPTISMFSLSSLRQLLGHWQTVVTVIVCPGWSGCSDLPSSEPPGYKQGGMGLHHLPQTAHQLHGPCMHRNRMLATSHNEQRQ